MEIGDNCQIATLVGNNFYAGNSSVKLNSNYYSIQPEYSNQGHGCAYRLADGAPVANPGPNQTVKVGSRVILNASQSGVGTPLTYNWTFTSRPPGTATRLDFSTTQITQFVADVAGTYVLQLTVSDGTASGSATVTVTAQ